MSNSRLAPTVVAAGAIGTIALALATTGTMSAFAASIQNTVNDATTGTLVLQEQNEDGSVTCVSTDGTNNAATCADINKYGGKTLGPGDSSTTTVTMSNTGSSTPKSFTLEAGECTQSGSVSGIPTSTDLCSQLTVDVYAASSATGTPIYSGSLANFTTTPQDLDVLEPDASQDYTFVVTAPSDLGNGYQGVTASQPLTWTMSS